MSLSPRPTALLLRHLHLLPTHYQCAGADAQRLTLIFFALAALDVLGSAHKVQQESEEWAQWIWERQAGQCGYDLVGEKETERRCARRRIGRLSSITGLRTAWPLERA
jgi:hypothetical protein